jgi:hypothetical protein
MKSLNTIQKVATTLPIILALGVLVSPASAVAPDGLGPWADTVVSSSQGLMKNGLPVPAIRSDATSALGIAEGTTIDGNFFSLGFGGNIVLGFDNGISSGVFVFEETNALPNYPIEKAKIEISENGTTWVNAGTVNQDGEVKVPDVVNCAKFVKITDISDSALMPDDIADGYDVDGVQAAGESCTPPVVFPSCTDKLPASGDKAHYTSGVHQIVGGALLAGSDDVYSLANNNYLQCFCPEVGTQGIQTNWLKTDSAIAGWLFLNGEQWNLGNVNYAAKNSNFTCQEKQSQARVIGRSFTQEPSAAPVSAAVSKPTSTPVPTIAPRRLGGLHLDGYCRGLKLVGGSAPSKNNTWICKKNRAVINITKACRAQYTPISVAKQDIKGNPYSWSCY